jgi:transcriptional regulator with XRE-family HTH domain
MDPLVAIIRKLRQSAGMTQAEMADLLRVPLHTLTKWEAETLDKEAKQRVGLSGSLPPDQLVHAHRERHREIEEDAQHH